MHYFAVINLDVGLRLVYYQKEKHPRIWLRSPGVSKKTIQSSAADFVPIYSGTYTLSIQMSNLTSDKPKDTMKRSLLAKMKDALIVKKVISDMDEND